MKQNTLKESQSDWQDWDSAIVAVLKLPPVISPKTAVQADIVGKLKEQARN